MKPIELPAYRAFMLATVPVMLSRVTSGTLGPRGEVVVTNAQYEAAISMAATLWRAIDEHVDRVAAEQEKRGELT